MIGYLLRRRFEVPAGNGWLTAAERQWFSDRRAAKRVSDWRLGRWTAKAAIGAYLERRPQPLPADIEVLAASDGAPVAFAAGRPLPLSLSLSHSHHRALCVVAAAGAALGCDLERIEPRSRAFVADYFTGAERAALTAVDAADRDLLTNLIWSAKESALKALRQGLRVDTRSVEVLVSAPPGRTWGRLEVICQGGGRSLTGRWTRLDDLLATIVCRPEAGEMVDLDDRTGGCAEVSGPLAAATHDR